MCIRDSSYADAEGNSYSDDGQGSGSYSGSDGSSGTYAADGSGSYTDADGTTTSWDAPVEDTSGTAALDGAYGDTAGEDMPPPEDDPYGAEMDIAAAQSDAKEMPADGGKEDSVADAKPEADDGIPKVDEDDKTLDG